MTTDDDERLELRWLVEIGPLCADVRRELERHAENYPLRHSDARRIEAGFFSVEPYWRGTWAHLEFESIDSNPFEIASKEFEEWERGWSDVNLATGAWEYPGNSTFVLKNHIQQILCEGFRTPRSAGIGALLRGEARASNPVAKNEAAHAAWDGGWLKGCWLKGHIAALLSEPLEAGEEVLRQANTGEEGPLPTGSEELAAWRDGWEEVERRRVFEQARRKAVGGGAEVYPFELGRKYWGSWREGWRAGDVEKTHRMIYAAGQRAFELSASRGANPHPAESEGAAIWIAGWEEASRIAGIEDMFRPDRVEPKTAEDVEYAVLLGEVRAAASVGTDAYVRGDKLESNPFELGTRQWRVWKRSWRIAEDLATGVYEDLADLPEDYDEDDREGNARRAAEEREECDRLFFELDMATEAAIEEEVELECDHSEALLDDATWEEDRYYSRVAETLETDDEP